MNVTVFDGIVYVRGVKEDGSVMKDEYLTGKGHKRTVQRFKSPGRESNVSKSKLMKIEKELQMSKNVKNLLEQNKKESIHKLVEKPSLKEKKIALRERMERFDRMERLDKLETVRAESITSIREDLAEKRIENSRDEIRTISRDDNSGTDPHDDPKYPQ